MTERSAQSSTSPSEKSKRQGERQQKPIVPPPPEPEGSSDTAIRPGFTERLQAKLSSSTGSSGDTDTRARKPSGGRGPRRARLRLTRIDPWSVMKTSFLLSIAFGVVTVVAVAMIWQVLGAGGVWDSINQTVRDGLDSPGTADFDVQDYVGTSRILGFTMLVAAVDVVLLTAIATLGAFLYNMSAALLGGVEVTLAEDN